MSICSTGLSRYELHGARPLAVSVKTARKLTDLGNTKIWELIKQQKLKTVAIGRRRLILYDSLEALIKGA
jgi:excisionase family DNA binding protein